MPIAAASEWTQVESSARNGVSVLLYLKNLPNGEGWDWQPEDSELGGQPLGGDLDRVDTTLSFAERELDGETAQELTPTGTFFEDVHVVPREFVLGLVVQQTTVLVEVFNAYRRTPREWQSWSFVDPDVTLSGAPALPTTYAPLDGSGDTISIVVGPEGEPVVDDLIDFVWDVATNIVSLSFTRVVPLAIPGGYLIEPEDEWSESFEFLTDVIEKSNGKEQRFRLRKNPRGVYELQYQIPEGRDRARLDMLLADLQNAVFGTPAWYAETRLTSAASAGDLVLNVQSTDFAEWRSGSPAVIWETEGAYDFQGVSSFTSTAITLTGPLASDFPSGARIAPVRAGRIREINPGQRFSKNLTTLDLRLEMEDNEFSSIADLSAFSTYDGRALFDDFNFMLGSSKSDALERKLVVFDNEVGVASQLSPWDQSRRVTEKGFFVKTREARWNIIRAIHALGGRHVAFWLPTFREDLVLVEDVSDGQTDITVDGNEFSSYIRAREPKNVIRIVLEDGSTFIRKVTSAAASRGSDVLTLDAEINADFLVDDVSRIEFLNKVRFDSDRLRFDYRRGFRPASMKAPVKEVLE